MRRGVDHPLLKNSVIETDFSSFLFPTRKTNSGQNGVWVYEIGSSPFFLTITPGMVSILPEDEDATKLPVTMLPRQPDEQPEFSTYEPQTSTTTEAGPDEKEVFPTDTPAEYPPSYPEAETITPGYAEPETEEPDYKEPGQSVSEFPESEDVTPSYTSTIVPRYPDPPEPRYPDQTETRYPVSEPLQPRYTIPETIEPRYSPVEPRYPAPDPDQPVPPYSRPHQPQIVVVNEDEDLDVNGKLQKLKTFVLEDSKCELAFPEPKLIGSFFGCFHSVFVQFGDVCPQQAQMLSFR